MINLKTSFYPILLGLVSGTLLWFGFQTLYGPFKKVYDSRPVVEDMRVIDSVIKDGALQIHVVGNKARTDCGPIQNISGYYGNRVLKSVVFLADEDLDTKDIKLPSIRNEGFNDFGWWELTPIPSGDVVLFRAFHMCGEGNSRQVIITEFALNIKDKEFYDG